MANFHIYFRNLAATGAASAGSLHITTSGVGPTELDASLFTYGTLGGTNYGELTFGGNTPAANFGATAIPNTSGPNVNQAGCWRSENPVFGTLIFDIIQCPNQTTSGNAGQVSFNWAVRVWKSKNADGTSFTEITNGIQRTTVSGLVGGGSQGVLVTAQNQFSAGLDNEYLWVEVALEIVNKSGTPASTDSLKFAPHQSGADSLYLQATNLAAIDPFEWYPSFPDIVPGENKGRGLSEHLAEANQQAYADRTYGQTLQITNATLPNGVLGSYDVFATASGGTGSYTNWAIVAGSLPTGLSINSSTGEISGTASALGSFSFTVQVTDSGGATATRSFTVVIATNPAGWYPVYPDRAIRPFVPVSEQPYFADFTPSRFVVINTKTLPNGTINIAYNQTIIASSGATPYTFTLQSGSLPTGLSISSAGVITGTPTVVQTSTFTILVTDSNSPASTSAVTYTISIAPNSPVTWRPEYPPIVPGRNKGAHRAEHLHVGDNPFWADPTPERTLPGYPNTVYGIRWAVSTTVAPGSNGDQQLIPSENNVFAGMANAPNGEGGIWTVGKTAPTVYALWSFKNTVATFGSSVLPTTSGPNATGDSGRTLNTLTGYLDLSKVLVQFNLQASSTQATGTVNFVCRFWKSTSPTGASNLIEIGSANAPYRFPSATNLQPAVSQATSLTLNLRGVDTPLTKFDNEYLFVTIALEITVASGSSSANVRFGDQGNPGTGLGSRLDNILFAPFIWYPEFPDIVPGRNKWNNRAEHLIAADNPSFTDGRPPIPNPVVEPMWEPCFPDMVARPALLTANQQAYGDPTDFTNLAPFSPGYIPPVYPDFGTAERPPEPLPVADHQAFASNVVPERNAPLFPEVHADRAPGPQRLLEADQQAHAEPTTLERAQPYAEGIYPDRALRAWLLTADQPFFAAPTTLERAVVYAEGIFPDRALKALQPVWDQPFVTGEEPKPEETTEISSVVYPDFVIRPFVRACDQPFVTSISPAPERNAPLFPEYHPDRVERPTVPASEQPFVTGLSPKPERTFLYFDGIEPEFVRGASLHVSEHQAFAAPTTLERAVVYAEGIFPDRAPRALQPVQDQPFVTGEEPKPEETIEISSVVFPDRVLRPFYPTTEQPFVTGISPAPERTASLAAEVHADRVDRPTLGAHEQQAVLSVPPQPERQVPYAEGIFPDRAQRALQPVQDQPFVTGEEPRPEQTIEISSVVFPDRVVRPFYPTPEQPFVTGLSPQPERPVVYAEGIFPDRALKAQQPVWDQPFVTGEEPKPEETIEISSVVFPDWLETTRRWFAVADQPFFAAPTTLERQVPYAEGIFPDKALRALQPVQDQPFVTGEEPKPEETTEISSVVYPDRIVRPTLAAAEHQFFAAPTTQERQVPYAEGIFPDRALRALQPVQDQPFVTGEEPKPEETTEISSVVYPDRATRVLQPVYEQPFYAAPTTLERPVVYSDGIFPDRAQRALQPVWDQPFVTGEEPQPEETIEISSVVYPDRIDRPTLPACEQQFTTELPPQPERSVVYAEGIFPDRATRALQSVWDQPFVTSEQPQPEETIEISSVVFPDAVVRPALPAAQQQAFVDGTYAWALTTPTLVSSVYPDHIARPFLGAERQQAFADPTYGWVSAAPALSSVSWPDRVDRPVLGAHEQLATTELSPQPERTAPLASEQHPDWIDRRFILTADQLAQPVYPIKPEEPTDLPWQPCYPDRATRTWFTTADQPFVSSANVQPERAQPYAEGIFPSWLERRFYAPAEQLVEPIEPQKPEETIDEPSVTYPERVRPAVTISTASQQAWAGPTAKPGEVPVPQSEGIFPDRIVRPVVLTADQPFVSAAPVQPERKSPLADTEYPERVRAATTLLAAEQQAFAAPTTHERQVDYAAGIFPDAVSRPFLLTGDQQALGDARVPDVVLPFNASVDSARKATFATAEQPFYAAPTTHERQLPYAEGIFPDHVLRPTLPTADQSVLGAEPIKPEEPTDLPWQPCYPDRATRRFYSVTEQPFYAAPTTRERQSTFFDAVYPNHVSRPFYPVHEQPYAAVSTVRPEEPTDLTWQPHYADWLPPIRFPVVEQLAQPVFRQPVDELTLSWLPVYQDRVVRPFLATADQPFGSVANIAPERNITFFDAQFPERIVRPFLSVDKMQAYGSLEQPESAPVPETWHPVYPDAVLREYLPVSSQLAGWLTFPVRPNPPAPPPFSIHDPVPLDRVPIGHWLQIATVPLLAVERLLIDGRQAPPMRPNRPRAMQMLTMVLRNDVQNRLLYLQPNDNNRFTYILHYEDFVQAAVWLTPADLPGVTFGNANPPVIFPNRGLPRNIPQPPGVFVRVLIP